MSPNLCEIGTQRLLLRRMDDTDLPAVLRIQADPDANRYNPHEQRNRVVIGVGGPQTTDHDGEPVLNLYYRFDPECWGQGFAPEMAAAAVSWAEREMPDRPW